MANNFPIPGADVALLDASGKLTPLWYQWFLQNAGGGGSSTITEANLSLSDVTTGNVSNVRHGFAPKITGIAGYQLTSNGTSASWTAPVIPINPSGLCINIMDYGGNNAGTADNDTAFNNAWAALGAKGGFIYFPAGRYNFASKIDKTLPNAEFSVAIRGAGNGVTKLYWPNSNGGMTFTYQSQGLGNNLAFNNMTFEGLTFVTGQSSGGYGLFLKYAPGVYQEFYLPTSIIDCSFIGFDDGYSSNKYWTQGNRIEGINNVNWRGCKFDGAILSSSSSGGQGVYLSGAGGTNAGILYRFDACTFTNTDTGFLYGPGIQGVTFVNCDFNGQSGTTGIRGLNDAGILLAQLNVANCQFDNGSYGIYLDSTIFDTRIVNCQFNMSKANGIGVYMPNSYMFSILGSSFQTSHSVTGVTGINVAGFGFGGIGFCQFKDLATGYYWDSGTDRLQAAMNSFLNVSTAFGNVGSSIAPGTGGSPAHP